MLSRVTCKWIKNVWCIRNAWFLFELSVSFVFLKYMLFMFILEMLTANVTYMCDMISSWCHWIILDIYNFLNLPVEVSVDLWTLGYIFDVDVI